jgi:hypothetical protein
MAERGGLLRLAFSPWGCGFAAFRRGFYQIEPMDLLPFGRLSSARFPIVSSGKGAVENLHKLRCGDVLQVIFKCHAAGSVRFSRALGNAELF